MTNLSNRVPFMFTLQRGEKILIRKLMISPVIQTVTSRVELVLAEIGILEPWC